ncbi:MAG: signal peptidase II [Verrucomicrobia bacterium]|nr:signal peptidase II [Verrucomicrobiota bacterium]
MVVSANVMMVGVAACVFVADQLTKLAVIDKLQYAEQWVLLDGFFKFVHWGNTGAAWSMFYGNNRLLAVISLLALVVLYYSLQHFDTHTRTGQLAMGLIFGGILGNLLDRVRLGHVVDFLYFHLHPRGGGEVGFPAFNVADSAICVGVGLLILLSFRPEPDPDDTPRIGRPA